MRTCHLLWYTVFATEHMYAVYMSTLGNRPELFPGSEYVDKYINDPPEEYEIPPALLSDETFTAIITEAEKYVGYDYGEDEDYEAEGEPEDDLEDEDA